MERAWPHATSRVRGAHSDVGHCCSSATLPCICRLVRIQLDWASIFRVSISRTLVAHCVFCPTYPMHTMAANSPFMACLPFFVTLTALSSVISLSRPAERQFRCETPSISNPIRYVSSRFNTCDARLIALITAVHPYGDDVLFKLNILT